MTHDLNDATRRQQLQALIGSLAAAADAKPDPKQEAITRVSDARLVLQKQLHAAIATRDPLAIDHVVQRLRLRYGVPRELIEQWAGEALA